MRLWILFKSSVLVVFFLTVFWQGKVRALPCYCEVEVEVQVPHSASIDTQGACSLLLLGGGGRSCFTRGLHWHCGGDGFVTTGQWWKSWLSARPRLTLTQQRRGGPPHNFQMEAEVQPPHVVSNDTVWVGVITYQQGWKFWLSSWPSLTARCLRYCGALLKPSKNGSPRSLSGLCSCGW